MSCFPLYKIRFPDFSCLCFHIIWIKVGSKLPYKEVQIKFEFLHDSVCKSTFFLGYHFCMYMYKEQIREITKEYNSKWRSREKYGRFGKIVSTIREYASPKRGRNQVSGRVIKRSLLVCHTRYKCYFYIIHYFIDDCNNNRSTRMNTLMI